MNRVSRSICRAVIAAALLTPVGSQALGQRQVEKLGRGVVAMNQGDGKVFVSWRLLGDEPDNIAFNLYRSSGGAAPTKLNPQPIADRTNFQDSGVDLTKETVYTVRPVINGQEGEASKPFLGKIAANAPARQYISIPIQPPAPGQNPDGNQYNYVANDCSVGDVDGDGEYEIFLKWDPTNAKDNSQAGVTGKVFIDCYRIDGTRLWRIDLGRNIRAGAHYTQFQVYDFDGDGKAEMICKTADGTTDALGTIIGDPSKDYRNQAGYVLEGPETLTVFEGATGRILSSIPFEPARGNVSDWGDTNGNRVDRFLAGVAYLDGKRPSAVFSRGYYSGRDGSGRNEIATYNWRDGKLSLLWHFKAQRTATTADHSKDVNPELIGQGNHELSVADVDGDGKDEIIYGAMCIDDDGKPVYNTKLGHGDALHVSDMDPSRPGLEVFDIHENPRHPYGIEFRDAKTGQLIWGKPGIEGQASPDVGRGVAMDVDPRYPGYEFWSSLPGMYNTKGEMITKQGTRVPPANFGIWWDGDFLREILNSNRITKWDWEAEVEKPLLVAEGCTSNNGTKSTPAISGDLFGDWREEVMLRTTSNTELRIYLTTIPTDHRIYTLMHDTQYREAIAWQNTAYNQPPHPSFFLGDGMKPAPRPNIVTAPLGK